MKRLSLVLILPAFVLVSCTGGEDTTPIENEPSALDSIQLGSGGTITSDASTISETPEEALEARRAMESNLTRVKNLLAETKALDLAKDQEIIASHIAEIEGITEELKDIDDFFIQANDIVTELDDIKARMDNFVQISDTPLHIDLTSQLGEASIQGITQLKGETYVVTSTGVLGPIDSGDTAQTNVLTFEAGLIGKDAAYSPKFGSAFAISSPARVWNISGESLVEQIVEEGAWYPATHLEAYASSLYTIDPINKNIWKYTRKSGDTFAAPVPALTSPQIQGQDILSMAIDGSIYVLNSSGKIMEFINGNQKDLEVDIEIGTPSDTSEIITFQNFSNLYYYDPSSGKLMKFLKDFAKLSIRKEYTLPQGTFKGLYITPNESFAYGFDDKKIYKIEL